MIGLTAMGLWSAHAVWGAPREGGFRWNREEPACLVASLRGVLGGLGAGLEHSSAREGALRGILGGALFGLAIVLVDAVTAADAEAELPHPTVLLAVLTAAIGCGLGALGGVWFLVHLTDIHRAVNRGRDEVLPELDRAFSGTGPAAELRESPELLQTAYLPG